MGLNAAVTTHQLQVTRWPGLLVVFTLAFDPTTFPQQKVSTEDRRIPKNFLWFNFTINAFKLFQNFFSNFFQLFCRFFHITFLLKHAFDKKHLVCILWKKWYLSHYEKYLKIENL